MIFFIIIIYYLYNNLFFALLLQQMLSLEAKLFISQSQIKRYNEFIIDFVFYCRADPLSMTYCDFATKEDAIIFCERNGMDYLLLQQELCFELSFKIHLFYSESYLFCVYSFHVHLATS